MSRYATTISIVVYHTFEGQRLEYPPANLNIKKMSEDPLPESVRKEIAEYVLAGRKIEAIKILRSETGASLRDSKSYVDAISMGKEPPRLFAANGGNKKKKTNETHPQVHSTGCGSSVIVFFLVASAAVACVYFSLTA